MSGCRRRSHFPLLQPGAVGVLATVAALASVLMLAAITMRIGATVIRRPLLALALAACAACTTACATVGATAGAVVTFEAALRAAGMTVDAYCGLTPEGRADLRARLNLPHLVRCEGDPPPAPVASP